jgi:hypothetical protein
VTTRNGVSECVSNHMFELGRLLSSES